MQCNSYWLPHKSDSKPNITLDRLENANLIHLIRREGVAVRASASQTVDLGFIPLVGSYQKTLKNGIYSFPAWCSAFMGGSEEQAGKFACWVLGQGT